MAVFIQNHSRVSLSELPSQMLRRFESEGSEGGPSISDAERQQLWGLYQHYSAENFDRLKFLQGASLFKEVDALMRMEKISQPLVPNVFVESGLAVAGWGDNVIGVVVVLAVLAVFGLVLGAPVINAIREQEAQLKTLDELKAKGEISEEGYKKMREVLLKGEKSTGLRPVAF